jgi:hypothetical protein
LDRIIGFDIGTFGGCREQAVNAPVFALSWGGSTM